MKDVMGKEDRMAQFNPVEKKEPAWKLWVEDIAVAVVAAILLYGGLYWTLG